MKTDKDSIGIQITRKKKRKGATGNTYVFNTIADITKGLNKNNYKRFLSDFKQMLEIQFLMQESINAMASADANKEIEIPLIADTFEWIDD